MKITADTNVLVRAVTGDNVEQGRAAKHALESAEVVALSISALCELVWVLSHGYKHSAANIAEAIRRLVNGGNVVEDSLAIQAGLNMLDAGGDFADGVIAYQGNWHGANVFVSFDRKAVKLLESQGTSARFLV